MRSPKKMCRGWRWREVVDPRDPSDAAFISGPGSIDEYGQGGCGLFHEYEVL